MYNITYATSKFRAHNVSMDELSTTGLWRTLPELERYYQLSAGWGDERKALAVQVDKALEKIIMRALNLKFGVGTCNPRDTPTRALCTVCNGRSTFHWDKQPVVEFDTIPAIEHYMDEERYMLRINFNAKLITGVVEDE